MNGKPRLIPLILFALIFLFSGCSAAEKTGPEKKTSPAKTRETLTETQSPGTSFVRWIPETELDFELGVLPAYPCTLETPAYDECLVRTDRGAAIRLILQGMDYANDFENLIHYLKSQDPDLLLVGKTSQTLIVVHGASETEICLKVADSYCLTAKGPDRETLEEFFANAVICVSGKELPAIPAEEEYEEF